MPNNSTYSFSWLPILSVTVYDKSLSTVLELRKLLSTALTESLCRTICKCVSPQISAQVPKREQYEKKSYKKAICQQNENLSHYIHQRSLATELSMFHVKNKTQALMGSGQGRIKALRGPRPIPNSSGGYIYTGWEKLIFNRNCRLSLKRCEIGQVTIQNIFSLFS